ncbi:hypothetical protein TrVE_jg4115 [Triparma verrucosa]|uniref:Uncharacterized protein n=1 Tax=Triparma verrucosa TaxID=1606542 RepID=A0A9W7C5J6_9STRA|nr:hypothetical protein TrVE_jg4115 [Triparma verrucosa]
MVRFVTSKAAGSSINLSWGADDDSQRFSRGAPATSSRQNFPVQNQYQQQQPVHNTMPERAAPVYNTSHGAPSRVSDKSDFIANQMALRQMEHELKYAKHMQAPAGASAEQFTSSDDLFLTAAHERPQQKIRGSAFKQPHHPHRQGSQVFKDEEVAEQARRIEDERDRREREREERQLYQAVQPGNNLNRHVTGQSYAQKCMQDMQEKQMRALQERQAQIEAERRDEERVRREAMQLRMQVQDEVNKQAQRHALVEKREAMAKQWQENNSVGGGVGAHAGAGAVVKAHSTADYFENRLSKQPTAHLSKLQQMREARWEREKMEMGRGVVAKAGIENERPNRMVREKEGGGGRMASQISNGPGGVPW